MSKKVEYNGITDYHFMNGTQEQEMVLPEGNIRIMYKYSSSTTEPLTPSQDTMAIVVRGVYFVAIRNSAKLIRKTTTPILERIVNSIQSRKKEDSFLKQNFARLT